MHRWLIILVVLLLIGCSPSMPALPTATSVAVLPTIAPTLPVRRPSPSPIPTITMEPWIYPAIVLPTPLPDKPAPPAGWKFQWLTDPACRLPCWAGIVPGRTVITDAIDLLNQSPFVATLDREPMRASRPDRGFVGWESADGGPYGGVAFDPTADRPVVTRVVSIFQVPFSLEAVMAQYGAPSHIIASHHHDPHDPNNAAKDTYSFYLIYYPTGFYLWGPHSATPPRLTPDIQLFCNGRWYTPQKRRLRIPHVPPAC